ncbi:DUF2076 domain-containing protein [Bradyrhizobium sp. SZCCHNS3002]|uniref:DUF2076 domain-containing protein n=1 Tax=unclassified Bradyrhizobium TaxID=2631580 RepID=UPI0028E80815|nr:DUF2076 domain-containing protein [Bradyrhizobium sp. SZCCHNS3002]
MTPQERQLIDDLFDRLAKLESAPRDPEAAAAISQALQRAPNAVYALVQTVLVQDEALKRANARIEELQHAQAPQQAQSGGFLDSMRDSIFGAGSRGSVPNVPPPLPSRPVWNSGQAMPPGYQGQPGYPGQPGPYDQGGFGQPRGGMFGGGGGSFLGTAAAAAAGMVGGSLLLGGIRSMMGGGSHQAFGDTTIIEERGGGASPWSGDQSGGSLARDAGLDDIGRSGGDSGRAGLFDQANYDDNGNDSDAADFDSDDGYGDDDGGSDYA